MSLSLVAQFDDLARKQEALLTEDIETEFIKFVWDQESCRQKWQESENIMKKYKKNAKEHEEENSKLLIKLQHARNQIDHEIRKRAKIETMKETMERNISVVRELLTDKDNQSMLNARDRERLAFLSTDFQGSNYESPGRGLPPIEESASLLSPDISYDNTGDDLDVSYTLRSGQKYKKRPSAPPAEDEEDVTPPGKRNRCSSPVKSTKSKRNKKHRRSNSASLVTTTSVTVKDGHIQTKTKMAHEDLKHRDSLKRYPSAGDIKIDSEEDTTPKSSRNARDVYTPRSSTMYRSTSNQSLNRPHNFESKTVVKSEQCVWCGRKITFGRRSAMRCKECKATCHPECKELVPLPCVPTTATPSGSRSEACTISDYAPYQPPYIPAIVIHCVNEIESRGFTEKGIYRLSGSEKEIKELRERFRRRTPNLGHITDINVICGCLKDFLRGLKEPLLTYGLWNEFVDAADCSDSDEGLSRVYQAISKLHRANRDTLAFIIIHLQKVSEAEECQMNTTNLARVFGPTIVGYSVKEPEPVQMFSETRKQQMVVEKLLSVCRDYWEKVITFEGEGDTPGRSHLMPNTPDVPFQSMLGPVGTPSDSVMESKKSNWYTPSVGGNHTWSTKKKPTQFFASPVLK